MGPKRALERKPPSLVPVVTHSHPEALAFALPAAPLASLSQAEEEPLPSIPGEEALDEEPLPSLPEDHWEEEALPSVPDEQLQKVELPPLPTLEEEEKVGEVERKAEEPEAFPQPQQGVAALRGKLEGLMVKPLMVKPPGGALYPSLAAAPVLESAVPHATAIHEDEVVAAIPEEKQEPERPHASAPAETLAPMVEAEAGGEALLYQNATNEKEKERGGAAEEMERVRVAAAERSRAAFAQQLDRAVAAGQNMADGHAALYPDFLMAAPDVGSFHMGPVYESDGIVLPDPGQAISINKMVETRILEEHGSVELTVSPFDLTESRVAAPSGAEMDLFREMLTVYYRSEFAFQGVYNSFFQQLSQACQLAEGVWLPREEAEDISGRCACGTVVKVKHTTTLYDFNQAAVHPVEKALFSVCQCYFNEVTNAAFQCRYASTHPPLFEVVLTSEQAAKEQNRGILERVPPQWNVWHDPE